MSAFFRAIGRFFGVFRWSRLARPGWFVRKKGCVAAAPARSGKRAGSELVELRAAIERLQAEIDQIYQRVARGEGGDLSALLARARALKAELRDRRGRLLKLERATFRPSSLLVNPDRSARSRAGREPPGADADPDAYDDEDSSEEVEFESPLGGRPLKEDAK